MEELGWSGVGGVCSFVLLLVLLWVLLVVLSYVFDLLFDLLVFLLDDDDFRVVNALD